MRKKILIGLLILLGVFLIGRSYISGKGENYFREFLAAYNRAQKGDVQLELEQYRNGWSGAETTVRVRSPALEAVGGELPFRKPLQIGMRVGYGPFFLSSLSSGLLRIESEGSFSRWLDVEHRKRFLETVPGDLSYRYLGRMDLFHVMHERIALSKVEAFDVKEKQRLILEPVEIVSDFVLASLKGRAEFVSDGLLLEDGKNGESLELERPRIEARIQEFREEGPIFGEFGFSADELRLTLKTPRIHTLRFDGEGELSLLKQNDNLADFRLSLGGRAMNRTTRESWEGVREASVELRLQNLGVPGIEAAVKMQREQARVRREMLAASRKGDDPAMQKAILALQALDGRWIGIYNSLFLPGKTRLTLDERIVTEKESRLRLDLTFTGERLQGDPMNAFISLAAHADRLAEGSFDLVLERALARKISPEAALVLDSMVEKGLAKLEEGLYRLKGEIRGGKIVINGTRYDPQELALMILI